MKRADLTKGTQKRSHYCAFTLYIHASTVCRRSLLLCLNSVHDGEFTVRGFVVIWCSINPASSVSFTDPSDKAKSKVIRENRLEKSIMRLNNFISFSNLFDDRSNASSKTVPPHSAIQSFLLQMRVSYPVLKVIQQLLTSSSSSSCHFHLPLYLSFDNLFQKAVST